MAKSDPERNTSGGREEEDGQCVGNSSEQASWPEHEAEGSMWTGCGEPPRQAVVTRMDGGLGTGASGYLFS